MKSIVLDIQIITTPWGPQLGAIIVTGPKVK